MKLFQARKLIADFGVAQAQRCASTRFDRAAVDAAVAMSADCMPDALDLGYATKAIACFPHKCVDETAGSVWTGRVDDVRMRVISGRYADGRPIGVPFGAKARIIQIYLTSMAIGSNSPEVELGKSMYAWLKAMHSGNPGGATYKLVGEQARRIAAMTVEVVVAKKDAQFRVQGPSIDHLRQENAAALNRPLHQQLPGESAFPSHAVLADEFWRAALAYCSPVRLSALRQISNRSVAIDVYIWLSHHLPNLTSSWHVDWADLAEMFGSEYRLQRQFRFSFLQLLPLILAIYPEANVTGEDTGLILHPSQPPITATPPQLGETG